MKLLFVCTGNTCRSPMAAALMNKIAVDNDMDIVAESAGIFAKADEKASSNAIKAMNDYGIDISSHKATPLTEKLINDADIVLTMTEGHKSMILGFAPDKIHTICEYAGYDGDINDPFGGNLNQYKNIADDIYDCLTEIAEKLYDIMENNNGN